MKSFIGPPNTSDSVIEKAIASENTSPRRLKKKAKLSKKSRRIKLVARLLKGKLGGAKVIRKPVSDSARQARINKLLTNINAQKSHNILGEKNIFFKR